MIVAAPVWNDRISPVFDTAELFLLVRWQGDAEAERRLISLPAELTPQQRVRRLVELGVDTVICGAIWRPVERLLEAQRITVHACVCGTVSEVLEAFRLGQLDSEQFRMPGCRGRFRAHRGCGRQRGKRTCDGLARKASARGDQS